MIELFLRPFTTLLRFLFYWAIYLIEITICFIFEFILQLLEYLIPIIFELIYLSVNTILTIKLYLISCLWNLLYYLISSLFTFIYYLITVIVPTILWYTVIFAIIILIIYCQFNSYLNNEDNIQNQYYQAKRRQSQNSYKDYYYLQNNYVYNSRRDFYSPEKTKNYSQNKRQQSQITIRQNEEEERRKQLMIELNENREMISVLQQYRGEIYKLKKSKEISKIVFKDALETCIQRIEYLQDQGKVLFLNLINIQDGICRVDFHRFYKAEINPILDGLFEQIRLYKYRQGYQQVKLKIIVGKGNNSKNGIPVIGPWTQKYLREYLQEEVEITNGYIEVFV
ncbi:unnamed protein product [Paramecium sonneborni]|uniref:Smr domain-containing protein n=1 Tax=Paramecium sonneborni TaxID=65129 RepID=A0A8S1PH94_9CILI|nr:unnamed protein product [Paramecium sonneborni]